MLKKTFLLVLAVAVLLSAFACRKKLQTEIKTPDIGSESSVAPTALPGETPAAVLPTEAPNVLVPAVMVEGTVYYFNSRFIDKPEEEPLGSISSIVPITEYPEKNDQANLQILMDAPYVMLEDGVALPMEDGWGVFVTADKLSE
ncbi:MAG: hypothetical protein IKZ82_08140 [Clostridia bacterium]|nr:hypothetical protein [Clostridia bacterium]